MVLPKILPVSSFHFSQIEIVSQENACRIFGHVLLARHTCFFFGSIMAMKPGSGLDLKCTPCVRERTDSRFIRCLAQRKPLLSFLLSGLFLLRLDTRMFLVLLFHDPPRNNGLPPFCDRNQLYYSEKSSKINVLSL